MRSSVALFRPRYIAFVFLFSGMLARAAYGAENEVAAPHGPQDKPVEQGVADHNASPWPNWMGPRHDGISRESGWRRDWPTEGLPILWTAKIGIGFSSCSLAGEHLFTMGHVDGREIVHCLDVETGKSLWTHDYPCQLVDNLHEGGPGATPTIDGDWVFTLGREGQLYCLERATGKVVWSRLLQEDLGVSLPEWGFTSSPYILDDQLILEAGRVVAYDKRSGNVLWKTETHDAGYGSACVFDWNVPPVGPGADAAAKCVATLDCDGLRVVNAATGEERAFAPWKSPFRTNSTTPIFHGDKLFISSAYNVGCGLFRLTENGLDLVYKNREMRNHFNNSILVDGYLYGFDGNSNLGRVVKLTCMEFETGKVQWQQAGFGCGSLMVADGKLLILSEQGTLVLASASPQAYEELARSPFLEGRCWTVPVLWRGRIYARNADGDLSCADVAPSSR